MLFVLASVVAGPTTQCAAIDESRIDEWNAQAWEHCFDYIFIIKKPETATAYTVKAVPEGPAGSEAVDDPIERAVENALENSDFAEEKYRIKVLAPEEGEILRPGGAGYPIRWLASGKDTEGHVELFYSLDKGKTWEPIPTRYKPNTSGSFNWDVPFLVMTTFQARVKVSWLQSENSGETVATAESPEFIIEEYFPPYYRESPTKQRERSPSLCLLDDTGQMKKEAPCDFHRHKAFQSESDDIGENSASSHFSTACASDSAGSFNFLPISFEEVMRP